MREDTWPGSAGGLARHAEWNEGTCVECVAQAVLSAGPWADFPETIALLRALFSKRCLTCQIVCRTFVPPHATARE